MRLGFAVKVLGRPELKSHDTRRWQNAPHLRVSLQYLREILRYLQEVGIRMYRFSSDLAPYLTHPDLPQFHGQLDECRDELAAVGALARADDIRLSVHPGQFVVLNSADDDVARKAMADIAGHARLLDLMGLGPEAVLVLHGGSGTGGMEAARERFIRRFLALPGEVQRRVALENDETTFAVPDILRVHEATGVKLIFDLLHFQNHNPDRRSPLAALGAVLATWPADVTPKIHVSTPRTAMQVEERRDPVTRKKVPTVLPANWAQHSDYADPFAVIEFLRAVRGASLPPFDIMLEIKSKDVGLLQLRRDLERFAPELAPVWF